MRPSDFWPNLVRDLMRENTMSQRALSRCTGLSRAGLRSFLNGSSGMMTINKLETVLAVFSYEVDAFPIDRERL